MNSYNAQFPRFAVWAPRWMSLTIENEDDNAICLYIQSSPSLLPPQEQIHLCSSSCNRECIHETKRWTYFRKILYSGGRRGEPSAWLSSSSQVLCSIHITRFPSGFICDIVNLLKCIICCLIATTSTNLWMQMDKLRISSIMQ